MEINLAGFNVDCDILKKLTSGQDIVITPETFSAAYARISRSEKDITSLRHEACADVAKARKSNKTIIFDMGHHSVAEHAIFNFDIMDVSRLALEELESFRLVSYTEKSQRYVRMQGDYLLPEEISDPKSRQDFQQILHHQNQFYQKALKSLIPYFERRLQDKNQEPISAHLVENRAKEDARYILSLATLGQVGLTINARNLEHLFRRFQLSSWLEIRQIGQKMYDLIKDIAPSIILFPTPSKFEQSYQNFSHTHLRVNNPLPRPGSDAPIILDYTHDADHVILSHLISLENSISYHVAQAYVERQTRASKTRLYRKLLENLEFFDGLPRVFEIPQIVFQASISASNYAQLKRHRMSTLLKGAYQPALGITIPPSIQAIGLDKEFKQIIRQTNHIYRDLTNRHGFAPDYILTNAHRRIVNLKMNLREFYHFVRLREDEHAQWDIRRLAKKLDAKVRRLMPLSGMMLCGKSEYALRYQDVFEHQRSSDRVNPE